MHDHHGAAMAVRELVDQPLKGLGELYENSLKALLVCGLEFYLSASLVVSFFQCPDESVQAEQELQTLYTMAWVPIALAVMLVYGPKLSASIFPSVENFERNMLHCKIITWIYAFCFLIWDPDMVVKTGPSLGVSALFCVADLGRFIMDMKHLTDVEVDDYGNSFIGDRPPHLEPEQQNTHQPEHGGYQPQQSPYEPQAQRDPSQDPQKHEESYTVHVIGANNADDSTRKPWQSSRQLKSQPSMENQPQQQPQPQQDAVAQGPPAPLFGASNKPGSRRRLGLTRKGKQSDLALNQSPSAIDSEYVAVIDPNSAAEKEATELVAKKSFTYEF